MLCPLPVYLNICVLIASCILARSDNGLQHQSYQSHCQPIFAIYLPFISRGLLVCEDLFLGVGVKQLSSVHQTTWLFRLFMNRGYSYVILLHVKFIHACLLM